MKKIEATPKPVVKKPHKVAATPAPKKSSYGEYI